MSDMSDNPNNHNIEIIVGTYEEFLLGYKLDTKNGEPALTQSFADKSHSGAIKCVSVQGSLIATGATDDRIFIYDMRTRKQSQIILSHEGTINALAFTPDETHLLSGSEDGCMIATRINTWLPEATWKKAHNGNPVTHICCHPSGKLALSLGGDLVLRTWNLVKGRVAYKTNLKSRGTLGSMPDCLTWSPKGDYFTLTGQRVVELWSIKSADVVRSQKTTSKPISICWIADETCLVGMEDGKIQWIHLQTKGEEKEHIIEAHKTRVKAMCFHNDILVTASSSGEIKFWQINDSKKKLREIAATNIGCRPTCLGVMDLRQFGDEYNQKVATEKPEEPTKSEKKSNKQQRGVVTIEYENEDNTTGVDGNVYQTGMDKVNGADQDSDDEKDEGKEQSTEESEEEGDTLPPKSLVKVRKQAPKKRKHTKQAKRQEICDSQLKQGSNCSPVQKHKKKQKN